MKRLRLALLPLAIVIASARSPEPPLASARTIGGSRLTSEQWRGRVVIINFWATWCAPCRAEMPALDAVYRRRHADGLEMLAVSMDIGASPAKLSRATSGYAFAVARLSDTRLLERSIPSAIPLTRIYDRQGELRYDSSTRRGAPLDERTLDAIVAPLLAEPAP